MISFSHLQNHCTNVWGFSFIFLVVPLTFHALVAASFVLQACLLPTPKGSSCANYARCLNQILQNLGGMQVHFEPFPTCTLSFCALICSLGEYYTCLIECIFPLFLLFTSVLKLWLRIPLVKSENDTEVKNPDYMVSRIRFSFTCWLQDLYIIYFLLSAGSISCIVTYTGTN